MGAPGLTTKLKPCDRRDPAKRYGNTYVEGGGVPIPFIENMDVGKFPTRHLLQPILSFKDDLCRERPYLCEEIWPGPVIAAKDLHIPDVMPGNV